MPINKKYPLATLMASLAYWYQKTKSRITLEYVLIAGFNDSRGDADQLIKFSKQIPSKINLIPCNTSDPDFLPPGEDLITWFAGYLRAHHLTVTLRLRKGYDIAAACGQLYAGHEHRRSRKIQAGNKINS